MEITIEGKNYTLDFEKAKRLGFIKEVVKRKIGQKYKRVGCDPKTVFTLAWSLCDDKNYVFLITQGGAPWAASAKLNGMSLIITDEMWTVITNEQDFELIED